MEEDDEGFADARVSLYENFVEGRLKKDLQKAMDERAKVEETLQKYVRMMEAYGSDMHSLDTLVNIGSDVLAQAHVPDTRTVCVGVGLGFFVELSRVEALDFTDAKVQQLSRDVENVTQKIAAIKANIKLAIESISKLAELEQERDNMEDEDED